MYQSGKRTKRDNYVRQVGQIPPKLHELVMLKIADGLTCQQISDCLLSEHKITVSSRNVSYLVQKLTNERRDIAKAAYANAVAVSSNQDVFILNDKITKFNNEVDIALENRELSLATKMAETLIKFVDRRMALSGIDQNNSVEDCSDILNKLFEKLGK